jgi:uncharacterized caspase-like protein/outer membrane protein OmpA-like peptidoglycan-associated protein
VRPLVAALVLLLPPALAVQADTSRRVALVIGNGAYQNAPGLPNPPRDVGAVAAALRGLGFEVIAAVDLDQPDMLQRLDEFAAKLEGAAVGLFFYAGHGLQVAGENYLVPVDARLQREAQVRLQTVPLQTVLATMEVAVPTRLVLLDACRDNPLAQQLKRSMAASRSAAVGQGLAEVRTAVGTLIAYATGPGDVASDGDGPHSPFTAALLEHIATPGLEVRQVLGRVRDDVLKQTSERQVPWDSSSLRGDFYFKPALPAAAALAAEAASPPVAASRAVDYGGQDRDALDFIVDSKRARDFAIFLERYPDSVLAPFAQSRLEELAAATVPAKGPAPTTIPGQAQTSSSAGSVQSEAPIEPNSSPEPATAPAVGRLATAVPLVEAPAPSGTKPLPKAAELEATLKLSRNDWRTIQQALTALGFDTRGADGRPGSLTRAAIRRWQKSKRLEATGYFDQGQRSLVLRDSEPRLEAMRQAEEAAVRKSVSERQQHQPRIAARELMEPEVISLQADTFFASGSAAIGPASKPGLDQIAEVMIADTNTQFLVWGFTSTLGDSTKNQDLSESRALSVAQHLKSKGVPASRLFVRGFGETNLAIPTPDGVPEPRNDRVEIRRR